MNFKDYSKINKLNRVLSISMSKEEIYLPLKKSLAKFQDISQDIGK